MLSQSALSHAPSEQMPIIDSMSSIFHKHPPSKRKLIRDTKNIKVTFGSISSNLLGPRKKNQSSNSDLKMNLYDVENEVMDQSARLDLLKHVTTAGFLAGSTSEGS